MKLRVLAVGKLKTGPEKQLAEIYRTRAIGLGRQAGITGFSVVETVESPGLTPGARMAEEAAFFTRHLTPGTFPVVLDRSGKPLASDGFADFLRRHVEGGTTELAFLIGGPDGHAPSIRQKGVFLLSLGPMTWPHRLVRVMLLEQVYRAVTILVGHPYHRY